MLATLTAGAYAQTTHIVDATGGGDFTTIQAAVDAAASGDTVEVQNTGLYEEPITIENKTLTIAGANPSNRPIVALQDNTDSSLGTSDAIFIQADDETVTLSNLILIPSSTDTPADDVIACTPATTAGTLDIVINNVLISANDGSDAPLQTTFDGDPDLGASGIIFFADDPFYGMTRTAFAGVEGVINTTFTSFEIYNWTDGTNADLILYPSDDGVRTSTHNWDGVYIVGPNDGTQVSAATSSDFTVNDYRVRNASGLGMLNFQGNSWDITNSLFIDCGGFAIRADMDTTNSFSLSDSLIANTQSEGFWTDFDPGAAKNFTIDGCTFFNAGAADPGTDDPFAAVKLESGTTADSTITVTDSVIAGPNTAAENLGGGEIVFDFCVLAQSGSNALAAVERNTSTGTVTVTNEFAGDPQFITTQAEPLIPESFDVTNPALETANSTGGELSGWGDFQILVNAPGWQAYE